MTQVIAQSSNLNENINKQLIWRRNAPYFYQTLYTQALDWPALSVQWWIPKQQIQKNKNDQDILLNLCYGTNTSGSQPSYLTFAKVYVPNRQYIAKLRRERPQKVNETIKKNDSIMESKIMVQYQVQHQGQVNTIRRHPKDSNYIATRTPLGQVHIFNKLSFKPKKAQKVKPYLILSGHSTEGFALQWNPNKQASIVAGSYDGKLTMWDINLKQQSKKILPLCEFNFHEREIEDVSHNKFHDCIFGSCDDGGNMVLWDTRSLKPIHVSQIENSPLYSLQFSPLNKYLLATGGEKQLIKLWDVRQLKEPIIQNATNKDEKISQLRWSRQDQGVIWSVNGNNITMWNMYDCKPMWVHAGHMQQISMMDVHPTQPCTIASVDIQNQIHVYQPTPNATRT